MVCNLIHDELRKCSQTEKPNQWIRLKPVVDNFMYVILYSVCLPIISDGFFGWRSA